MSTEAPRRLLPPALRLPRPQASPLPLRVYVAVPLKTLLDAWPSESIALSKHTWFKAKGNLAARAAALPTFSAIIQGSSHCRFGNLAALRRADDLVAWELALSTTFERDIARWIVEQSCTYGARKHASSQRRGKKRGRKKSTCQATATSETDTDDAG